MNLSNDEMSKLNDLFPKRKNKEKKLNHPMIYFAILKQERNKQEKYKLLWNFRQLMIDHRL